MAQFEIIKDVTQTLTKIIGDTFKEAGYKDIEIYNVLPTEENIKKLPAICLFLTSVNIDRLLRERDGVFVSETTEDGKVVEYETAPPVNLWLYFMLSAWGKTPQEEHVLLGLAMRTLMDHAVLSGENFDGESLQMGEELPVRVVDDGEFGYDETMAFWRSLGEPVRPTMLYKVGARLYGVKSRREIRRVMNRELRFPRGNM